VVSK